MKILILEDDPFLAEMLINDVTKGFTKKETAEIVGPVDNFADALNIIRKIDLDLAILDISLGEDFDGGIRLAQVIKRTTSIPIIFLSALPRSHGFDKAKLTGPFAYLSKPYTQQDLIDQMELALNYQLPYTHKSNNIKAGLKPKSTSKDILFIKNSPSKITPIPLDKLIVIEADNKLLKMYIQGIDNYFFFNSPGLKNFYDSKLSGFSNYVQVNKTYVINTLMINEINDNHIFLKKPVIPLSEFLEDKFPKSIPIPTDTEPRKKFFKALGV